MDKVEQLKGQVVKNISNRYIIKSGDTLYTAHARGRIKLDKQIYVGDRVVFTNSQPFAIIEKILDRKTQLIRPYIANIDTAIIVIAKEPVPDLALVDKIIVNCYKEAITPVLCYNKSDLATKDEINDIFKAYQDTIKCMAISSLTGEGVEQLAPIVDGNLVGLAGQSAVGKTSLLNYILDANLETGELSQKILRGKNTTRHIEIFDAFDGQIIDTCGFSMLDMLEMEATELKYYYPEYVERAEQCHFSACDHINEPKCAVKGAVNDGDIDMGRYQRYNVMYKELKENWSKRYG